jgi:hypothetical protein
MEAQKNEIKAEIRRKSGMEAELASKIYIVSSLLAAFALVC